MTPDDATSVPCPDHVSTRRHLLYADRPPPVAGTHLQLRREALVALSAVTSGSRATQAVATMIRSKGSLISGWGTASYRSATSVVTASTSTLFCPSVTICFTAWYSSIVTAWVALRVACQRSIRVAAEIPMPAVVATSAPESAANAGGDNPFWTGEEPDKRVRVGDYPHVSSTLAMRSCRFAAKAASKRSRAASSMRSRSTPASDFRAAVDSLAGLLTTRRCAPGATPRRASCSTGTLPSGPTTSSQLPAASAVLITIRVAKPEWWMGG